MDPYPRVADLMRSLKSTMTSDKRDIKKYFHTVANKFTLLKNTAFAFSQFHHSIHIGDGVKMDTAKTGSSIRAISEPLGKSDGFSRSITEPSRLIIL